MTIAVDFSDARPPVDVLKAVGVVGVLRYLAPLPNPKVLTAAERDEYLGAGLMLGVVWETTAGRAAEGYPAGRADAIAANAEADDLDIPDRACIYYAVDGDYAPDVVRPYFQGAKDVGGRPVGVYGGFAVVDAIYGWGLARYGWQTLAWSHGQTSAAACLYQKNGAVPIPGYETDLDLILRDDWGQWPFPPGPTPMKEYDVIPGQCRDLYGRKWHFYVDDDGQCSSFLDGVANGRVLPDRHVWTSGFDAECDLNGEGGNPKGTIAVCGRNDKGEVAQIVLVPDPPPGAPPGSPAPSTLYNVLGGHVYPPG